MVRNTWQHCHSIHGQQHMATLPFMISNIWQHFIQFMVSNTWQHCHSIHGQQHMATLPFMISNIWQHFVVSNTSIHGLEHMTTLQFVVSNTWQHFNSWSATYGNTAIHGQQHMATLQFMVSNTLIHDSCNVHNDCVSCYRNVSIFLVCVSVSAVSVTSKILSLFTIIKMFNCESISNKSNDLCILRSSFSISHGCTHQHLNTFTCRQRHLFEFNSTDLKRQKIIASFKFIIHNGVVHASLNGLCNTK